METRNITISIEEARKYYNSNIEELKKIALQAFTKEELKGPWSNIKTFDQACEYLNLAKEVHIAPNIGFLEVKHLEAVYKMDIIRRALNYDTRLRDDGTIYIPCLWITDKLKEANKMVKDYEWEIVGKLKLVNTIYYLVGSTYARSSSFMRRRGKYNDSNINAQEGLFACKSPEIAAHMSRYFVKEMFDVIYSQDYSYTWMELKS